MDTQPQAMLNAILQNAVDAIITIDQRGQIDSCNHSTLQMFGYTKSELIGQNIKMLMPAPYRDEHDGYLQAYQQTGERKIIGIGREVVGRRKDGSTFPAHLAVSEFQTSSTTWYTGIVRDISDLKSAERELRRLNDELEQRVLERTAELESAQAELVRKERLATLGQVSGGIAHEIRNPLNAVKTSAYFLMNAKNPSEAKTLEHLQRIDRQVTLIDKVITALADVARMPEPVLHPLALQEELYEALNPLAVPHGVQLDIDASVAAAPPVLGDSQQLRIVFTNLVRNAFDAMSTGGSLRIAVRQTADEVSIDFADTGVGIPAEQLAKITEPLYSTKSRGMGLGLAICKAIVSKLGGRLEISSEVKRGSVFSIVLSAADETQWPDEPNRVVHDG